MAIKGSDIRALVPAFGPGAPSSRQPRGSNPWPLARLTDCCPSLHKLANQPLLQTEGPAACSLTRSSPACSCACSYVPHRHVGDSNPDWEGDQALVCDTNCVLFHACSMAPKTSSACLPAGPCARFVLGVSRSAGICRHTIMRPAKGMQHQAQQAHKESSVAMLVVQS